MAIKDEYEVARLYTDGSFDRQLKDQFAELGSPGVPPGAAASREARQAHRPSEEAVVRTMDDARLPHPRATHVFSAARCSTRSRALAERRWERQLLADYETTLDTIEANLSAANFDAAIALAAYPRKIRGYGHVKEAQARVALAEREKLMKAFLAPETAPLAEAAE